jgi:hypothetical protein
LLTGISCTETNSVWIQKEAEVIKQIIMDKVNVLYEERLLNLNFYAKNTKKSQRLVFPPTNWPSTSWADQNKDWTRSEPICFLFPHQWPWEFKCQESECIRWKGSNDTRFISSIKGRNSLCCPDFLQTINCILVFSFTRNNSICL